MVAPAGRYTFGPDNGRLLLHTRRAGLAGSLGHDLTIEVSTWSAEADVGDDPTTSRLAARIDLTSLTVVEGHGGATPLRPSDRQEIEKNARKSLDTARFPEAVFDSTDITQSASGQAVDGSLTLHGRSEPQTLQIDETSPGVFRCHGTVVQTRFGIKPYSAMLGALKIRDEVDFEIEVEIEV